MKGNAEKLSVTFTYQAIFYINMIKAATSHGLLVTLVLWHHGLPHKQHGFFVLFIRFGSKIHENSTVLIWNKQHCCVYNTVVFFKHGFNYLHYTRLQISHNVLGRQWIRNHWNCFLDKNSTLLRNPSPRIPRHSLVAYIKRWTHYLSHSVAMAKKFIT